jgi:hypothetical protein
MWQYLSSITRTVKTAAVIFVRSEIPQRNSTWRHWEPPRRTERDITSFRPRSKQQPVVCLRLIRWRRFLPSFRHFVILAPGTGEPISCTITVTISSASNLRCAVAHWRSPQLNQTASTQPHVLTVILTVLRQTWDVYWNRTVRYTSDSHSPGWRSSGSTKQYGDILHFEPCIFLRWIKKTNKCINPSTYWY